jgi:DNA excision repair protein ERCC-4
MASKYLNYQTTIIEQVYDPSSSDLLVLARGLGLRKVICALLKLYTTPEKLVIIVGASAGDSEDSAIGSELSTIGVRNPGLRLVDYEMTKKDR